jgi:hypothetical protein
MSASEKPLRIDVPVKLSDVKVVFSIGALAFEGDLAASIFTCSSSRTTSRAGARPRRLSQSSIQMPGMYFHDTAYNADRNIATGNPYKDLISDLQKRGVKVELCGATAKVHGWGNEDLLAHIKVNTDAMARMTQLVQQGFVKIIE